jgi:hypothetical protein
MKYIHLKRSDSVREWLVKLFVARLSTPSGCSDPLYLGHTHYVVVCKIDGFLLKNDIYGIEVEILHILNFLNHHYFPYILMTLLLLSTREFVTR